ncbi:MAG TPA: DUF721 domain-containing protein [Blastocatellia bacterium]|nr:DUF721 domain-containing protein [Blastocatellia bacterium]
MLLPQMLRRAGDSDEARQQAVFAAWAASIGSQLRKVTAPVRLERKSLIVAVTDATWQGQLARISGQMVFRLNSLLGAPVVTSIEFVINRDLVESSLLKPPKVVFNAPDQQASSLSEPASRIPDPEMRAAFLRAAGKCLDRRAK